MGILIKINKDNLLVEKSTLVRKSGRKNKLLAMTEMQSMVGLCSLKNYKEENRLRIKKAKIYNSVLKLYSIRKGDVFFHFPVKVRQIKKVKLLGWKYKLDIQDDYCEDVDKLWRKKKVNEDRGGVVYLPTGPEIPNQIIKKIAKEIKIYIIQ